MPRCCKRRARLARTWRWRGWTKRAFALATTGAQGSAVLEVTQGRQPCWKLNLRFGVPDMSARVQNTLRAGWYCRTLQAGVVQAGTHWNCWSGPTPAGRCSACWPLIRDRECHPAMLNDVLALPLPPSWHKLFTRRRDQGQTEDWSARLRG